MSAQFRNRIVGYGEESPDQRAPSRSPSRWWTHVTEPMSPKVANTTVAGSEHYALAGDDRLPPS